MLNMEKYADTIVSVGGIEEFKITLDNFKIVKCDKSCAGCLFTEMPAKTCLYSKLFWLQQEVKIVLKDKTRIFLSSIATEDNAIMFDAETWELYYFEDINDQSSGELIPLWDCIKELCPDLEECKVYKIKELL